MTLEDPRGWRALPVDRLLELLAVFVLAVSLIGLATALAGVFHAPQLLVCAVLITAAYARWAPALRGSPATPSSAHLSVLLLVGLLFRVPAYNYVIGGQDEGLYVNIAANLVRTGGIVPGDPVAPSLHDPAAVETYVKENYAPRQFLNGIYRLPGAPPRLEFQFYHLFPVWMAFFAGLFGQAAGVYALTLLALVSLLFLHRLTLAITGSASAALIGGMLLAVNPLHAFFSKFPVSEVPTLAFSAIGFTFLTFYWRAEERAVRPLILAALAFLCVFTMRISGFMYLPFLLLISSVALIVRTDRSRAIHRWVLAVVGLYGLSVLYGLAWSGTYSRDVYAASFELLFGARWKESLSLCLAIIALGWAAIWIGARSERGRSRMSRLLEWGRRALGPSLVLILLLGAYRVYALGFVSRSTGDFWLDQFNAAAGGRWRAFEVSSVVVSAEYLFPPTFIALVAAGFRRWEQPAMPLLLALVLLFFAHLALLQWWIPYQPYYARYLVSEFVPYTIVFLACALAFVPTGAPQRVLGGVLLLGGLYGAALSAAQIGKQENEEAAESLARLTNLVDRDDLLLIDADGIRGFDDSELRTPLTYLFGLHVARASAAALTDGGYLGTLSRSFDDLFLASCNASPPPGFLPVDSMRFRARAFEWTRLPPVSLFQRLDARLYLFRFDRTRLAAGMLVDFRPGTPASAWLRSGWSSPESWGSWAVGHAARLEIDPRAFATDTPITAIKFHLTGLVAPSHPDQLVRVRVDGDEGRQLHFHYPESRDLALTIPLRSRDRTLAIELEMPDAVSPASIGVNGDTRIIGAGLRGIELIGPTTQVAR